MQSGVKVNGVMLLKQLLPDICQAAGDVYFPEHHVYAVKCTQEHWAPATLDSGLHTRYVASQQSRPLCRLQNMDSHSWMRLSETASVIKHHWWAVIVNRMTYYISQGTVETPTRKAGKFCCSFVANLLHYQCAKTCQMTNAVRFDKVIGKIKECIFCFTV